MSALGVRRLIFTRVDQKQIKGILSDPVEAENKEKDMWSQGLRLCSPKTII